MKFKVQLSTGWIRKDFCSDLTEQEAIEICEMHDWHYTDENCFDWCMDYVEE